MKKSEYKKFSDAQVGEVFIRPVLVTSVSENQDKYGKPFVKINMKDGYSEISSCMFKVDKSDVEKRGVFVNSIATVQLCVSKYNGQKSFTIEKLSQCTDEDVSIDDFIKMPPFDCDMMFDEICSIVESSANDYEGKYTSIAELTLKILNDKKSRYMTSSAAVTMHHNMRGGLLYHSYRMVKAADAICNIYTSLDRELLICGTALHDIGKIWEYNTNASGEADFTSSGVLFGHLYLGASLIKKYTEGENYNTEKVQMLTHLILSHHGTREFGAVVCPALPEAFALFYIDNLDAKMYVCEDNYEMLQPGTITDKKPFGLDNRIYKPKF